MRHGSIGRIVLQVHQFRIVVVREIPESPRAREPAGQGFVNSPLFVHQMLPFDMVPFVGS